MSSMAPVRAGAHAAKARDAGDVKLSFLVGVRSGGTSQAGAARERSSCPSPSHNLIPEKTRYTGSPVPLRGVGLGAGVLIRRAVSLS